LLETLRNAGVETHLVISDAGEKTIRYELGEKSIEAVKKLADFSYDVDDIAARIASGSFETDGMVVIPCSMKTLSAIANGFEVNLIIRAADICLKLERKLILVPRETPLALSHIENMRKAKLGGASIVLPVPAYYTKPKSIGDVNDFIVGRVLELLGIKHELYPKWKGMG
jgi:4-hydroxy-3-polyprenylbenzoate decarboxylase